jgi:hypothetical protein
VQSENQHQNNQTGQNKQSKRGRSKKAISTRQFPFSAESIVQESYAGVKNIHANIRILLHIAVVPQLNSLLLRKVVQVLYSPTAFLDAVRIFLPGKQL